MNEVKDARIAFYLKHQDQIDQWAGVRRDALGEAHRFFLSLADDLEEVASALGSDVRVWARDGKWSNVGFHRTCWLDSGEPSVSVDIEWRRHETSFIDGYRMYGVRMNRDHPGFADLREALASRVRPRRQRLGFRSNRPWPVAASFPAPIDEEYWIDLSSYRRELVGLVKGTWVEFIDDIDSAVTATSI